MSINRLTDSQEAKTTAVFIVRLDISYELKEATSFLYSNHWIENVLDILHDWQIFKIIAHACSKHNILSATSGISESIIGAEERGEGAGDGVAVGGDGGGGRHPVVQDALLSPILLLVRLQGVGPNLHLQMWDLCKKVSDLAPFDSVQIQKWTQSDKSEQTWTKEDNFGQ